MYVKKVETLSNKKKKIHLDDDGTFVLYASEVRRFDIEEDKELTEEIYQKIMGEVLMKRSKLRAMHLLTKMDYTEVQLRRKLKQSGYPEEIMDKTIAYLYSYHYLDDERYARSYISYRMRTKSRMQLIHELQTKGVPSQISSMVYDELAEDSDSEAQAIQKAIAKKRIDPAHASKEEIQKLYGFLARKGFSHDKIRKAIKAEDQFD